MVTPMTCQTAGGGVAEGVEAAVGVEGGLGGGGEDDAGGADGGGDRAGARMPMPTAPAPWSPAPAATGVPAARPVAAAPSGEMRAQISGPSKSCGEPGQGDAGGGGDFGGPAAVGDVEQEGAGGFLHVHGVDRR